MKVVLLQRPQITKKIVYTLRAGGAQVLLPTFPIAVYRPEMKCNLYHIGTCTYSLSIIVVET